MDQTIIDETNDKSIIVTIKNIFSQIEIDNYLLKLKNIDTWFGGNAFGHEIKRMQRWYHVDNKYFGSKWITEHKTNYYRRWESNEYEEWLLQLQTDLTDKLNGILEPVYEQCPTMKKIDFNSVLINKYRDGTDFIPAHRDNEEIFGDNPTIVSLSFGETRTFIMQRVKYSFETPLTTKLNKLEQHLNKSIMLDSGTILIMAGSCQKYFIHQVPKDETCTDVRFNLTFRNIA